MDVECEHTPSESFVIVDVETSGMNPSKCRVISLAALEFRPDGTIGRKIYRLLDPEGDPGPTNIHGLTREMLVGQPRYREIAAEVADLVRGHTMVAHNVAFDYAFLAAEAHRADAELPVESVMCTVELAGQLNLEVGNLKLATLAKYWGIPQARPHDALDDALVLSKILACALTRAQTLSIELPIRSPLTLAPPVFTMPNPRAA